MSDTPSSAVRCATLAPPVRRTSSRILAWRMAASTSRIYRAPRPYRIERDASVAGSIRCGSSGTRSAPTPSSRTTTDIGDKIDSCRRRAARRSPAAGDARPTSTPRPGGSAASPALTPLEECIRLSARDRGPPVLLKREDLQVVRSYKVRGAFNLMSQLSPAERAAGVVCASAGNHAQGVAFACRALDIRGRIYLPNTTPRQKRDRILSHGAGTVELVLSGDTFDDAALAAAQHAARVRRGAGRRRSTTSRTIAGQGTVVRELLQQLGRPPDVLIVPVGGGGLIAGRRHLPARAGARGAASIGVEPAGAPSMQAALAAGGPVPAGQPWTRSSTARQCAGSATCRTGSSPPPMCSWSRSTRARSAPRCCGCTRTRASSPNRPARWPSPRCRTLDLPPGSTVVALITGGNNDVSRYGEIVERSLVHLGLKHYFLVDFPQEPGALRRFLDEVLGPDDDITLFEYVKRNNRETGPALVGVEIGSADGLAALLARMAAAPMEVERILPGLGGVPVPDVTGSAGDAGASGSASTPAARSPTWSRCDTRTGRIATTKTPSTPADPADGFLTGIGKILGLIGGRRARRTSNPSCTARRSRPTSCCRARSARSASSPPRATSRCWRSPGSRCRTGTATPTSG